MHTNDKRSMVESVPVPVALHDLEQRIVWANAAYRRAVGLPLAEIEGRACHEAWGIDAECHRCAVAEAIARGQATQSALDLPREGKWLCKAAPLWDEAGTLCGAISCVVDVSAGQETEDMLRTSEQQFRTLAENAPDIIARFDPDLRHTYVNPVIEHITGIPADRFVGKTHRELGLPPEQCAFWEQHLRAVFESGAPRTYDFNWEAVDGQRYFETQLVPERAADGAITHVLSVTRDITARKKAEIALRESQALLQTTGQMAKVGGWELDAETLQVQWTDQTCRIHGMPIGYEPPLDTALDYYPPEDRKTLEAAVERALEEGIPYDLELGFTTAQGQHLWVHTKCQPQIKDGKTVKLKGTFQDITERVKAEKQLERYSKQLETMVAERTRELGEAQEQLLRQERLATLGQLAGGLGHELRNPLGAIKNAAYVIEQVTPDLPAEAQEGLEILNQQVSKCNHIIRSLLDFARGRPPVRRETDLNRIVEQATALVDIPRGVELALDLEPELPALWADPDQLVQALRNIVLNAVQAMPEGGQLTIESEASLRWVTVRVRDTGIGIPAASLNRIFEPLYTTKPRGIGLGLALTKALIEGHDGTIEAQSSGVPGTGSTFTIRLPLGASAQMES